MTPIVLGTGRTLSVVLLRVSFGICLALAVCSAQVDTGTLGGTVHDQSGAVLPGAVVTLTNEDTSVSRSMVCAADGTYLFALVKVGNYTVSAAAKGFRTVEYSHVRVDIQQHAVIDLTLTPGVVSESVQVTAAPLLLQSRDASVGEVVGSRPINDLPLNGRNYTFLAQLTAGVTAIQTDDRGLLSSGSFAANGTRFSQSNYMLDGIDNNSTQPDFIGGTGYAVLPPVDAIQEFKIQTGNYSAEFGRAAGAVLNATIKSGTNQFHGNFWEFLRNDKLDAADFFENANGIPKGEYRQNQFGLTVGGPVILPKYNGRNKTFFFADYEGLRIRQGFPVLATVPTAAERQSGFSDFSDLISGQAGTTPGDALGRNFPLGTVFDPATTRPVTAGRVDAVTGLAANASGYVRDPFPGNAIPSARLDPNAVKLMSLYPLPTGQGLFDNYAANPAHRIDGNSGDGRIDQIFGDRDQMFVRYSYNHKTIFTPGRLPGLATGAGYGVGDDETTAQSAVLSETHTFSPRMINEFRVGFTRQATTFSQPDADVMGVPEQFGIQGIPQTPGNGGLPWMNIGGLEQLGPQGFLPTYKHSNVWDVRENITRVQGAHSLKLGYEYQFNFIPFLVPPFSRGQFNFRGTYTSVPGANVGSTGRAQFVLRPVAATVPGGIDNVGGADSMLASTQVRSTEIRKYHAAYVQDDWKVTRRLTLNLGVRYEYFSPYSNRYNAQAQFVPGPPFHGAQYLFPADRQGNPPLSSSFVQSLQKDGIDLVYSNNVNGISRKDNFAPRFGFAYQPFERLVIRGGYAIFYGGFENSSGLDHLGTNNYPFLFSFAFPSPDPAHPIRPNNSIGLLENGLENIPINSSLVTSGFNSIGREYSYPTPYTQSTNLTLQFQLTPSQSVQIGYVGTFGRHLEVTPGANLVPEILPPLANPQDYVPFPDFAPGFTYVTHNANSNYNALQTTFERRFSSGVALLANYTWSKCLSDARDNLVDPLGGYRAAGIPGFGIAGDYGLCEFDVRQIAHVNGSYELPFGKGRRFLSGARGLEQALAGGWQTNWIVTLQDGMPITIPCTVTTAAGVGCNALMVPGQSVTGGRHDVNQWMNPAAFTNPPVAAAVGQTDLAPLGGAPTQVIGPGFHRLDVSLFKQFDISEAKRIEFRAEFFNVTNTPNFGNSMVTDFSSPVFGKILATRDNPNDPRQIQFALKFYW